MKKLNIAFLLMIITFCASSAYSQCCCSYLRFSLVNKKGQRLDRNKVRIENITDNAEQRKVQKASFYDIEPYKDDVHFDLGCGRGNEILLLTYKGSKMKINFKFLWEFGAPYDKIVFQKGNFTAEHGERADNKITIKRIENEKL